MKITALQLKILTVVALLTLRSSFALDSGEPAPELKAKLPNGIDAKLSAHRGKVVYLDFWASWCGPCRQSFAWMNAMHEKYRTKGLEIIAVNLDAKESDVREFLQDHPAKFTIAFDPAGVTPLSYAVKGMPTSYLIGRDGRVVAIHSGFNDRTKKSLESAIIQLIGEN